MMLPRLGVFWSFNPLPRAAFRLWFATAALALAIMGSAPTSGAELPAGTQPVSGKMIRVEFRDKQSQVSHVGNRLAKTKSAKG